MANKTLIPLILCLLAIQSRASTNVLELQWTEPPGFQSTLYTATNVNGQWTPMGTVQPPVFVEPTNQISLFYVTVAPTNQVFHFTGCTDPLYDAPAGAEFINTNTGDIWFDVKGGTNGWVWYFEGFE